ncbi:MAG: glycerol kinase GlpK [Roseiflexaceae bacterium]
MRRFVLAIDQGTTSTRCMIFDQNSQVLGVAQHEHAQIYPQPGWVEHNPDEIWQRTQQVIVGALAAAKLSHDDIAAIGITNQRETTVVWNKRTGQPYANAIVWQDMRTDAICRELGETTGADRFRQQTGLPLATYFAGPKLVWLLRHIPGLREDAEAGDALFGTIDTFLIWQLTGGVHGGIHITDVTNAGRTLMMNLATLDWDNEIVSIMGIPRAMLPTIRSSSEVYGIATGLLAGVPVAGALGDQHAAMVGQACIAPGDVKNTYGTGCFMLLNTGTTIVPSHHGLLTTMAYKFGDQPAVYALEGSIAIAGALIQWLRDNLGIIAKSSDVEALAASVPDNGGTVIVPAFSGLFAPHWRSDARGVITGLTRYITKAHIARAALEAVAWQTREVLDAMEQDSGVTLNQLKVDGGMTVNNLLMQFQSDVVGVPVIRPVINETTALGAAYAAGIAVGVWNDFSDVTANWREDQRWLPTMDETTRATQYAAWKKAVTRTLNWIEE